MEQIFIIKERNREVLKNVDSFICIDPSTEKLSEDYIIHDWILEIFRTFNPTSLIIPLSIQDSKFLGLEIGLHIRLNFDIEFNQRCIPILFISNDFSYETIFADKDLEIRKSRNLPHYLLTTPNVYLENSSIEPNSIRKIIGISKPMTENQYRNNFLSAIKILPSETVGKHSIANIWGAFQLAKTTNLDNLLTDKLLLNKKKDLYFKYILANSYSSQKQLEENADSIPKSIRSKGKNILLIDDEAKKGWDVILKEIFKEAKLFHVVDKSGYESFTDYFDHATREALAIENDLPKWDLILLDLRLDEDEDLGEKANKIASDYSGAKLLKSIKDANKGTQVIMFTASNKAWNMRELLDIGADGFFIKESPEYSKDESFGKMNYDSFEKQVENCFSKQDLRIIFCDLTPLAVICKSETQLKPDKFSLSISQNTVQRADEQLDIVIQLLKNYELKWTFISLVYIIEEIVREIYYIDGNNDQVVSLKDLTKVKCNYQISDERFLSISPVPNSPKYTVGEYKIIENTELKKFDIKYANSTPFNFRLSFILHFKYKIQLDQSIFKYFSIYNLRSDSVAHAGNKKVTSKDILLTIELIRILIQ